MITIRNYRAEDYAGVRNICVPEGDDSNPMMANPAFRAAIEDVFCRWYLENSPESCFIAADENGNVKGYILCAKDFTEWEKSFRKDIMEKSSNPAVTMMGEGTVDVMRPYAEKYPSHLHIDLAPDTQGQGVGRKLMEKLCEYLRENHVRGLMLNVAKDNTGAMKFYEKLGFSLIGESENENAYGIILEDKAMDHGFMIPAVNGEIEYTDGVFALPERYSLPGFLADAEEIFAGRTARIGNYACDAEGTEFLTVTKTDSLPEEGYELEISETGVTAVVSSDAGYRHALETLFVLLATGKGKVSCTVIKDAPRFAKRSIMLDCCRHFFSVDDIKKIIEQSSMAHFNMFHWHLSDDQGYRIESRKFPELNSKGSWRRLAVMDPMVTEYGAKPGDNYGGYYTEEDIRDVVEYAAVRGIDVVPEIDLPGHCSAILSTVPHLTCSGEPLPVRNTFGVHQRIFCAGKEETFEYLEQLIDEVAGLFPSEYFHLGGDEAPKAEWKTCPKCRARMTALGYTSYESLQCYFTERLAEHLKSIGKTPICWNESAISGDLTPDAVVQYWAEMGAGESYCAKEISKGRKFMLANCDQFYCTDSYAAMSLGCTQQFEPNVKGDPVPDENVFGVEMPMWTEWTPTAKETEPQMFPRLLAVAECGWTKDKDEQDLLERAKRYLEIPALNVMSAPAWEKIDIKGDAALQEIAVSLVMMGSRYHKMAEAEKEAGGDAGVVAAVEPDDEGAEQKKAPAEHMDPRIMIRSYVAGKMTTGFTEEDIDKVTNIVLSMMARR